MQSREDGMVWDWIAKRKASPRIGREILKAVALLCEVEGDVLQARTQLNNLALSHKCNLDEVARGGTWREAATQLNELAASASHLSAQFKHLREGALLVLLKEACGAQDDKRKRSDLDGLIPELQMGTFAGPILEGKVSWDVLPGPSDAHAVREVEPQWITRTEALAEVCREGARIAERRAAKRGRRTSMEGIHGSPELQILKECAVQLKNLARDDSKALALARVVHHLVTGELPSPNWATEAKRQFDPWWAQVREWWGREAESPDEVQALIRNGPQVLVKRRYR